MTPMQLSSFSLVCALCLSASNGLAQSVPRWAEYADMLIHNAKIITVDDEFTIAEAATIKNGRFEYVGTNSAVLERAGPKTRVINLYGRTVLPGMADTHNDIAADAEDWLIRVNLSEATSIAEIKEALAERAGRTRRGEWILGSRGWWEYELKDGRIPMRSDLDEATPNHPTCIPGPHYQICNSLALEIGGVTRNTPDPPSGQIWRDESGELTGLLMDAATSFVTKHFPTATRTQKRQGL